MSIDITYFVLDILQVVISRLTYYISFERMCLTGKGKHYCFVFFLKLALNHDHEKKNFYDKCVVLFYYTVYMLFLVWWNLPPSLNKAKTEVVLHVP